MRLDKLLIYRNLVESRQKAQALIMSGNVIVDGQVVIKPSKEFNEVSSITIKKTNRYVSRGGQKLEFALKSFKINPEGKICLDVGSSTGGFTDCLLQLGAKKVYCVDVGKGLLHWKLRNNTKVVIMEGYNFRYFNKNYLKEFPKLVTIDVSFISLKKILPSVKEVCVSSVDIIALVKPQFEIEKGGTKKGVVIDPEKRLSAVEKIITFAKEIGFDHRSMIESPLKGPKGNTEYFIWLRWD